MQIEHLDPDYSGSQRAHANFRLAVKLALSFVGLLWLIHFSNWALDLGPEELGLRPREWSGLLGVVFAPLLHANFEHLLGNTLPLLVVGTTMLYLYPRATPRVLPAVYLGPGLAVWLFGRSAVHIGASGIIYGLVAYVLLAGLIRRDRRAIGASLMVCFMYGTMVWGVLPIRTGVSWETHLAAAVIGLGLALALRRFDIPPRKRYSWDDETGEAEYEVRGSVEWNADEVSTGEASPIKPSLASPRTLADARGELLGRTPQ